MVINERYKMTDTIVVTMKKILYLTVATLSIFACSCSEKKSETKPDETQTRNIVFESYSYDQIGEYSSQDSIPEPGGKYIRFIGQGVLPQDIGDTDIKHLRDTLIKISNLSLNEDNKPIPDMPTHIEPTDLLASDTEACGEVVSTLTTTLVNPRVVVWENLIYSYACGAAHGNQSTIFINFSMSDGKILTLNDLFKPNYRKPLTEMVRAKLKESSHNFLTPINEISLSDEFAITSKGLMFNYDQYEIAPYSEGAIQVELSSGELSEILSPEGLYILTGLRN